MIDNQVLTSKFCGLTQLQRVYIYVLIIDYLSQELEIYLSLFKFPADLITARQKLADYYNRELSELSLYTASGEANKVPLPKLYVPMTWRKYNQGAYGEEEKLTSYMDIWKKVSNVEVNKLYGYMDKGE